MRRFRIFVASALGLVGCAQGGKPDNGFHGGGGPDGGGIQHPDADPNQPDAEEHNDAAIDAPPGVQQVNLQQDTDSTIAAQNSIACTVGSPDVGTTANTYYRVFDLPSLGITTDFTTAHVDFQVEDCESINGNGTSLAVRVGTYSGTIGSTLDASKITILQSNNSVPVPEVDETATSGTTPGAAVSAPITTVIPGGSKLVVEVDAPDGKNTYQFYIASNQTDESGTSYVSAAGCSPPGTTPSDMSVLAAPRKVHILLGVTGTYLQ